MRSSDDAGEGPRPVRLVGRQWSRGAHEIKDSLARYHVAYEWVDAGSEPGQRAIHAAATDRLPLLLFPDGSRLADPTPEEVAAKLGLITEEERPFHDLLIVGGGPAGLAAAVYAASEGLRTLVIEQEVPGGQASASARIENYLGFPKGLSGGELARRAVEQAKRFGVEFLAAHGAVGLRAAGPYRIVTVSDGTEHLGYTVLLATGVAWRRLEVPGAEQLTGRGVFYGAVSAEAALCRDEEVCVLGGGNSAGQAAMLLARHARAVHILTAEGSLDASMSQYLAERVQAAENVRVHPHTTVAELHGTARLQRVTLENTRTGEREEVSTRALFVFIGGTPRTEWLAQVLERDEQGFILAGSDLATPSDHDALPLQTSMAGVFAAGDARCGSVKRVVSAAGEGASAVQSVHRYLAEL